MTNGSYQPGDDEPTDLDAVLGDDEVDEALDTAYSPPERPRGLDEYGTTAEEELRGETLDQRLAREVPDPAMEVDLVEGEPAVRAGEGSGAGFADRGEQDEAAEDGLLDDGEVGDARAGRLVAPDEGAHEDTEKDLIATDVGIDAGAASAEEAAMHVVDSEQESIDEGSTR